MKLATWNVNSLKVRLPQVLDWLKLHQPDILCLQETKLEDTNFPAPELQAAGYQVLCSGQKTYNGVAMLTRNAAREPLAEIPGFSDPQKRVLAATIGGVPKHRRVRRQTRDDCARCRQVMACGSRLRLLTRSLACST